MNTYGAYESDDKGEYLLLITAYQYHQSLQQQEAQSSRSSNPIYRKRDVVEERLLAGYFCDNPKYSDHYFRPGTNNDLNILSYSPLFEDLIALFEVNGVAYEKGYYLADGIYPHWKTFFKSFMVAQDEIDEIFKSWQESARKDVKRAFGVL
nr:hypothetical protein [Tanacetum cinerariifolium]